MSRSMAMRLLPAVLMVAVLVTLPALVAPSTLYSLTDVAILALFAISFNMLFGYAGLLSFGHAAYFGVGAYVSALMLSHLEGTPVLLALAAGTVAAGVAGLLIGLICVRRTGPYFAMLTMAFGMLIFLIAWKWRRITGGDDGMGSFVPTSLWLPLAGRFEQGDLPSMYLGVLGVVIPVCALLWALLSFTPYGNAVRSIRLNEERASFLGFDVFAVKAVNFTLASAVAGLAGALYAIAHDFVSPQIAGMEMSTDVVMMTFIGGAATFLGPIAGTLFFVFMGDFLAQVTERWQMVMGAIFIFMVMFAPGGFIGSLPRSWLKRPEPEDKPADDGKRGVAQWT